MTEYWLQKKNLGGWSTVTWYSDFKQAIENYNKCVGNGMSGYSWRLMKVEALEVSMLEEVTEIEAPQFEPVKKPWTDSIQPLPMKKPWGSSNGWDAHSANPAVAEANKPEHGLTGSVWVIHHGMKHKARVAAGELELYLEKGYERGGPKTKFRE